MLYLLFYATTGGFCPAWLCTLVGLVTSGSTGSARRVGRWCSRAAALYFSAAALLTLYHITTYKGPTADGAGPLLIWLFIAACVCGAYLSGSLALGSRPDDD
jgi:hypothetical protein